MSSILDFLLLAVLGLSLAHFLLPHHPLLREARGQLALSPPPSRLLGETTGILGLLLGAAVVFALLASARLLPGMLLAGLLILRLGWLAWRKWHKARVVFDRSADCIRQGPIQIGRASEATVVHVTGERAPALALYLRDETGESAPWVVPGVYGAHAPEVGRAIADYLGVPLVTRLD